MGTYGFWGLAALHKGEEKKKKESVEGQCVSWDVWGSP